MFKSTEDITIMDLPFILTVDNRVEEVNALFLNLTGYAEKDILGKKAEEVWRYLLRINIDKSTVESNLESDGYMFDKNRIVKEVTIKYSEMHESRQNIYTFQQKKNSIFEEKYPFLELTNSANDTVVALCSIPDFVLLKANNNYFKFFGKQYSALEDIIGLPFEESIPNWNNTEIYNICLNAAKIGTPVFFNEKYMEFPEIGNYYARFTLTPIYDEGRVKYLALIHNDVTERVLNRQGVFEKNKVIEEQKNRLKSILETLSASLALCIIDKYGDFVGDCSIVKNCFVPFKNSKNIRETYAPGVYFDEAGNEILEEDLPISRVLMGEKVSDYKLTIKYKDGIRHYVVNGTPIFDVQGNLLMGIICGWEITERVEYQQLLEEQRDYLYKLFNSLDLPILYLSYPDFKVIELNKKVLEVLKEMTGLGDKINESDIIGRSLMGILPMIKDYDDKTFLEQLNEKRTTLCHEKMEVIKKGHKAYYNVTYHPILNLQGNISELLVAAIDVTAEVEKRQQMEDVLKLKDEFLYLISHEFKTPLTVINAAVQNLEHIYASQIPEKPRALIEKIKQNAYRQLRLVNNLLDITRINAGQIKLKKVNMDIVFLARVITESVAIYAQQKGVEISFKSKIQYRVIGVDDEKFERILLNLLSNAIKFTPSGKKVAVELTSILHKGNRVVCIKVKDQGIGIPKDKQSVIFERFGQVDSLLTRQAEGTGIGLFLVKLLVNAFEGEVLLESEEGQGSIFTLLIPSKKAKKNNGEREIQQITNHRLVEALATEFSDIYL